MSPQSRSSSHCIPSPSFSARSDVPALAQSPHAQFIAFGRQLERSPDDAPHPGVPLNEVVVDRVIRLAVRETMAKEPS